MEARVISVCRTLRKPLSGGPVLQSQVHSSAPQLSQTSQSVHVFKAHATCFM